MLGELINSHRRRAGGEPGEDARAEPDYVKGVLDRMNALPERNRIGQEYVHASNLMSVCVREEILAYRNRQNGVRIKGRVVDGGMRIVWALGRAIEKDIREKFLKYHENKNVLAVWSCACGKAERKGFYKTANCETCGTRVDRFHEIPMFDEELKVVGNADMIFRIDGEYQVLEIKSINKRDFDTLDAAKPDHELQASIYTELLRRKNVNVGRYARVLYAAKDYIFGQSPYKEFLVDTRSKRIESSIALLVKKAREIKYHKENGTLPERTECKSAHCSRAKQCPVVVDCFSLE